MNTVYMDQISEHQRDLTNSASSRFNTELIVALYLCTQKLTRTMESLVVDTDNMRANLQGGIINAEAAYIILALHGHKDAHEVVRRLTLQCHDGQTFIDLLFSTQSEYAEKFTEQQKAAILDPVGHYTQFAAKKVDDVIYC
jgi:adenylosuccinate lyase